MPNACGKTWGGATLILSSLRDQTPHSRVTWSLLELLLLSVLENRSQVLSLQPNSDLRNTSPGPITFSCTAVANEKTSLFLTQLTVICTSQFSPGARKKPKQPPGYGQKIEKTGYQQWYNCFLFQLQWKGRKKGCAVSQEDSAP